MGITKRLVIGTLSGLIALGIAQAQPIHTIQAAAITSANLRVKSTTNSYIAKHKLQTPKITKEWHTFEMFGYKTKDGRPNGIVFHQTADPHTYSARSEANYEINTGWKNAFVHTFVDAKTILNIHNTDYGCWGQVL